MFREFYDAMIDKIVSWIMGGPTVCHGFDEFFAYFEKLDAVQQNVEYWMDLISAIGLCVIVAFVITLCIMNIIHCIECWPKNEKES